MSQTNSKSILVKNAAHTGYRRAGVAFKQGENSFLETAFTESQLAQLKADPRLSVSFVAAGEIQTGQIASNSTDEGTLDGSNALSGVIAGDVFVGDTTGPSANESTVSLVDAIGLLKPDDESHFTKGGKPEIKALEALIGGSVTAAERDAAWEEFKASQDQE